MASGDTLLELFPLEYEPPAVSYATIDSRNGHVCLDFDGTAEEDAIWTAIMPRNYVGGGITVNLLIGFTSATSGTSRWEVSLERMDLSSLDVDADSFAASQSADLTAPGTSGQIKNCAIAFTNGAQMDSIAAGEMFRIKVHRDTNASSGGTDDITTDAELYGIEIKET